MPVRKLSHVGLCVSDLARARRFYCGALGFEELGVLELRDAATPQLLGIEGAELDAVYLRREGTVVELLCFPHPGVERRDAPRPVNRVGLTHLSLLVDDLDATLALVVEHGGRVLAGSRIGSERFRSQAQFVLDPDATRIELVQGDFDPASLPRPAPQEGP
jgi:catechol 2,3-dioxygenase-like lactoylglutathione lyase family enzyme